jgi:hypothetical protein
MTSWSAFEGIMNRREPPFAGRKLTGSAARRLIRKELTTFLENGFLGLFLGQLSDAHDALQFASRWAA